MARTPEELVSNILGDLQELAAQYRDNIGQCPYCKKSIPAICDCCGEGLADVFSFIANEMKEEEDA